MDIKQQLAVNIARLQAEPEATVTLPVSMVDELLQSLLDMEDKAYEVEREVYRAEGYERTARYRDAAQVYANLTLATRNMRAFLLAAKKAPHLTVDEVTEVARADQRAHFAAVSQGRA